MHISLRMNIIKQELLLEIMYLDKRSDNMKKILTLILTIILTLSMMALLVVPSFADSKEEEKILEAAKKGTVIYHFGIGDLDTLLYIYENKKDFEENTDVAYTFMRSLLPKFEGKGYYTPPRDPSKEHTEDCIYSTYYDYVKLGDGIKKLSDLKKLCNTYLTGFTGVLNDEFSAPKKDCGCFKSAPSILIIDGEAHISTNPLGFDLSMPELNFEDFEVESYDSKKAVVSVYIPYEEDTFEVDLVKEDGQWKVCGGTLFTEYFPEHGIAYCFVPSTGEDFSVVSYTLVIAASVVLMVLLVKVRKRTV